jgi:hypothetical protein
MNNKNTVPPLIISKARIQSVLNKTPKTPTTPDHNGFSSPTNYKRLFSSSQSSSNNHQKKQATYVLKNRFSLLSSNVTYETADQAHLNSSMDLDLDNDPNIIETKPPPPIFFHTVNDFAFFSFSSISCSQATKKNKAIVNHSNASSEVNADQFSLKLSSFIEDLKSLITPLISLLTTVIDMLIISNNVK